MTRTRKTSEEIRKEYEERALRAEKREQKKELGENPLLKPLFDAFNSAQKDLADNSKGLDPNGKLSFVASMKSHRMWLDELEARIAYETERKGELETTRNYFKKSLDNAKDAILSGTNKKDTRAIVAKFIAANPNEENKVLDRLEAEFENKREARKSWTEEKKETTRKNKPRETKEETSEAPKTLEAKA